MTTKNKGFPEHHQEHRENALKGQQQARSFQANAPRRTKAQQTKMDLDRFYLDLEKLDYFADRRWKMMNEEERNRWQISLEVIWEMYYGALNEGKRIPKPVHEPKTGYIHDQYIRNNPVVVRRHNTLEQRLAGIWYDLSKNQRENVVENLAMMAEDYARLVEGGERCHHPNEGTIKHIREGMKHDR